MTKKPQTLDLTITRLTFCLVIAALFGSVKEGFASNVKAEPNSHVCGRATYRNYPTNIIHWTDGYIREEYVREGVKTESGVLGI